MTDNKYNPSHLRNYFKPAIFLAISLTCTLVIMVFLGLHVFYSTESFQSMVHKGLRISHVNGQIMHYDEILTMSAKMAAASRDPAWEARYHIYETKLSNAISELYTLSTYPNFKAYAQVTDAANDKLVALEKAAFRYIKQRQFDKASALLSSKEYQNRKNAYSEGMQHYMYALEKAYTNEFNDKKQMVRSILIAIIIGGFILVATWIITTKTILQWKKSLLEAKAMEEQSNRALSQTHEDLKTSHTELEHFNYVVCHDLQEPLRTVFSFIQLLEQDQAQNQQTSSHIGYIKNGINHLRSLVNDLLHYSKIRNYELEYKAFDCNENVEHLLGILDLSIQESQAIISYDRLPVIYGIPSLLSQLFQNILSNAIKFRKKDTIPAIHISAHYESDENSWLFSIRDNGIGVEKEYFSTIFTPFKRLHAKSDFKGSGLGLAICKKVIDIHKGDIWVESEYGEGSCFYFRLPCHKHAFNQETKL